MIYTTTGINESATISEKAGADIADVRGKAVKYDANGDVVLAAAGENMLGISILTNMENIKKGEDVDIQIKDIGLCRAGAAFKKGELLAADAQGCFVKATTGNAILGIAKEAASAKDVYVKIIIARNGKATA